MDVYLVPLGHDRHELYCEVPDAPDVSEPGDAPPDETTSMGRMKARFVVPVMRRAQAAIADAEREWREHQAGRIEMPATWWGRVKARMRAWVAEKVAEQRLLWHMRRQDACALFHAEDMPREQALAVMREILQRDYERHRKWFVIHTSLFILSGLLFLVPGPNLVAYIFLFRLAGHYLSMKGARQGLDCAAWTPHPCRELCDLRAAAAMPPVERADRVRVIERALGLEHLATFFNRVAAV
jgi:hypothetical protein